MMLMSYTILRGIRMKIVVYDETDQEWGKFYVPDDASKEWIEMNVPPIIRTVQLLMGNIDSTGY